jgi:uncharacterized protein (DUF362 family)
MAKISIIKTTYVRPEIERLLEPLGGMGRFIEKGDEVLLKVNLLSPSAPEEAVTTHPEFVRAVAREVKRAGGFPFIGDSPIGRFSRKSLNKTYQMAGIEEMAREEQIPLNYDTGTKKVNIPSGRKLKQSPICSYALDADKIIALPKLKTHSFQYMTLACKIMYGTVPGITKAKYHALFPSRAGFADMLLDICLLLKPDLFIMDGILGMEGEGPGGGGDPVELGFALASTDAVAMDISVCRMIGIEPVGIPVLKRAKIRDLWPDQIEYPILRPEDNPIKGFKLPNTASHLLTGKKASNKGPIITDKCIGCGECEKICPKGAVTVVDHLAKVMYSKCIRCFCCHEICPERAIRLGNIKIEIA